jgi:RNA-directed DNA polymerase
VLTLIEAFLKQGVMETGKGWQPTTKGTPQGAVLSPLLANVYLHPLDLLAQSQGWRMTRYADDFIIQCSSSVAAETALAEIRAWMAAAGLTLHPTKTRIVDATTRGGFDFLGWHFERGLKWPRKKSLERFQETLRAETPRNNGRSLPEITRTGEPSVEGLVPVLPRRREERLSRPRRMVARATAEHFATP